MAGLYRLTYDASTEGDGSRIVEWEKTAAELLMPNGAESLLDYMLRETDARGGMFRLERLVEVKV